MLRSSFLAGISAIFSPGGFIFFAPVPCHYHLLKCARSSSWRLSRGCRDVLCRVHQHNQYHLRGNMQLRCNTQCQSHRAYRRRCFIQAGGQWKILIYADKNASSKEQRKVHRQNGRGGFDGTAIDSAPKELGAVPLTEGRGSIGKQNCQRGGFHAACRRAGRSANEHQKDHHTLRRAGHGG